MDNFSEMTLIGVLLVIDGAQLSTSSDEIGNFVIEDVPIGRQIVKAQ